MRKRRPEDSPVIFGLTGGIGSGKSSVRRGLARLGAAVIDADKVVSDLNQPGELGHVTMRRVLGEQVIDEDGALNTKKAASLIFANTALRQEVQRIIHPEVWRRLFDFANSLDKQTIAVFEIPLLKPEHTDRVDGVVVVNTEPRVAVERLGQRGFTPEEAIARINTQVTNAERAAMADFVINNNGTPSELEGQISSAWQWMQSMAQS